MIYLYNIALFLFFIPTIVFLALRYKNRFRKEVFHYWKERLGSLNVSYSQKSDSKPILWIHCASLGEVRAIEPLLKRLTNYTLLLTTITFTGRQYAEKNKLADYIFYAPLDFTFFINKAIRNIKPAGLILVETEFWPSLIYTAHKNNIKILLINGRLSIKSYRYYKALKCFWKPFLNKINLVAARFQEDAERFISLGISKEKVLITGNIKYDFQNIIPNITREEVGFNSSDLVFVAGSTRKNEEEIIIDTWLNLKTKFTNLKLIIAPRHLERIPKIINLIKKRNIEFSRYSEKSVKNEDFILLDTFGDLQKFYSICDISFVGGSLTNKGGQNPIEPAVFSKPVVFGSYMQNFLSEANILQKSGGGIKVNNSEELIRELETLIYNEDFRNETGINAYNAVNNQRGALIKTSDLINTFFPVN